jgi:hypothetical protein
MTSKTPPPAPLAPFIGHTPPSRPHALRVSKYFLSAASASRTLRLASRNPSPARLALALAAAVALPTPLSTLRSDRATASLVSASIVHPAGTRAIVVTIAARSRRSSEQPELRSEGVEDAELFTQRLELVAEGVVIFERFPVLRVAPARERVELRDPALVLRRLERGRDVVELLAERRDAAGGRGELELLLAEGEGTTPTPGTTPRLGGG